MTIVFLMARLLLIYQADSDKVWNTYAENLTWLATRNSVTV